MTTPANPRLRIGAVSYLNTKPLVYGLADRIRDYADLEFAVPSKLAARLHANDLDVGLIPAIECFRHPELDIISDACIACEGPVWSVQALFRKHPSEVKTLAIDEGSRTSVALTQILLFEKFGVVPETTLLPLTASLEEFPCDAMLVIGDRAMHLSRIRHAFCEQWDLGQAWLEHTGLPFVFAMWVARPGLRNHPYRSQLCQAFETQRDQGLLHAESIAAEHAGKYGLTESQATAYLTRFLHYKLAERQHEALALYRDKADRIGLLQGNQVIQQEMKVSS